VSFAWHHVMTYTRSRFTSTVDRWQTVRPNARQWRTFGAVLTAPASLCVLAKGIPDHKQLIFTAFDPVKGLWMDDRRKKSRRRTSRSGTHWIGRRTARDYSSTIRQRRERHFRIWICTGIRTLCGKKRHRLERVESRRAVGDSVEGWKASGDQRDLCQQQCVVVGEFLSATPVAQKRC
jgi:hypothetical protein